MPKFTIIDRITFYTPEKKVANILKGLALACFALNQEMSMDQLPSLISKMDVPCFLIAAPGMVDPLFKESVVLLLSHNEEGSMGFIMNKKSNMAAQEMIECIEPEALFGLPIWTGGPVAGSGAVIIHNMKELCQEATIVSEYLCLSVSQGDLVVMSQNYRRLFFSDKIRIIAGYSGWAVGQLHDEIRLGAWLHLPLEKLNPLEVAPDMLWQESLIAMGIGEQIPVVTHAQVWLN